MTILDDPEAFLKGLFERALEAADTRPLMRRLLPSRPSSGRLLVLGAGKAAAAMAKAVEEAWGEGLAGLVVVPDGYELELESIELQSAGHPIPDERGEAAARKMMMLAGELGEGDTLLALFSGGGSALLPLPKVGLSLADKQRRTEVLLKSGAPISEINQLRRSLSAIKGGGLARAAKPARILSFIASDVPGDDPADVASGPSILPKAERDAGEDGDQIHVIVSAKEALAAAEQAARGAGLEVALLGDDLEGEASQLGRNHALMAMEARRLKSRKAPLLILSGGEAVVTVTGPGRGGPNMEYLLSLSIELDGADGIWALAADSDGNDGSSGVAGALSGPGSLEAAKAAGLDPAKLLADNDSLRFFEATGGVVRTGPTLTNVNDFRAILIF